MSTNPIIEDISGFEECRGCRGFSINTTKKQIINTNTHRLNHSKDPSGMDELYGGCAKDPRRNKTTLENGDYYVNIPKNRISGITHNVTMLYSEIEKIHKDTPVVEKDPLSMDLLSNSTNNGFVHKKDLLPIYNSITGKKSFNGPVKKLVEEIIQLRKKIC